MVVDDGLGEGAVGAWICAKSCQTVTSWIPTPRAVEAIWARKRRVADNVRLADGAGVAQMMLSCSAFRRTGVAICLGALAIYSNAGWLRSLRDRR